MKTDRELLELAAKAAGLRIDKSPYSGGGAGNNGFDLLGNAMLDWHNNVRWNPLTDDGDALRLAVKLRMDVVFGANYAIVNGDVQDPTVNNAGDPYAATRRAIVRAAAEIGKAMP